MSETFTYENLLGGDAPDVVQVPGTVAISQSWARGQLVGLKTSTGYWQTCDFTDVSDFSDFGIAVEAVDTMAGSTLPTTIFVEGSFNRNGVAIGYGDDYADWDLTLRNHGIYLRASVNTSGV